MSYSLPPRPEFYIPDALIRAREEQASRRRNITPAAVLAKAKVGLRNTRARAATAAVKKARDIGTGSIRKTISRQNHKETHGDLLQIKQRITGSSRRTRGSVLHQNNDNSSGYNVCYNVGQRKDSGILNHDSDKPVTGRRTSKRLELYRSMLEGSIRRKGSRN